MKRIYRISNVLTILLFIAGVAFGNTLGMVLVAIGFLVGIVGGIAWRIYLNKRLREDLSERVEEVMRKK